MGGKTPAEVLNQQLFKYFSAIKLLLPVLTLMMPSNTKGHAIDVGLKEKIKAELLIELRNTPGGYRLLGQPYV